MAAALGISIPQFRFLAAAGFLKPFTKVPGSKWPWRLVDGTDFLDRLTAGAVSVLASDDTWISLPSAAPRVPDGLTYIVDAVLERRFKVGTPNGADGFAAVVVHRSDVARLLAEDWETDEGVQTLPEFERLVGLRTGEGAMALVEDDHMSATILMNVSTAHLRTCITEEDAEAFHTKFVTTKTYAQEAALTTRSAKVVLQAAGVKPFSPDGRDYGRVFLRTDVPIPGP